MYENEKSLDLFVNGSFTLTEIESHSICAEISHSQQPEVNVQMSDPRLFISNDAIYPDLNFLRLKRKYLFPTTLRIWPPSRAEYELSELIVH